MSYLKVSNPSDKDVANTVLGEVYSVKSGGSEKWPTEVALHLVGIYPFLTIEDVREEAVKEIKEDKKLAKAK